MLILQMQGLADSPLCAPLLLEFIKIFHITIVTIFTLVDKLTAFDPEVDIFGRKDLYIRPVAGRCDCAPDIPGCVLSTLKHG